MAQQFPDDLGIISMKSSPPKPWWRRTWFIVTSSIMGGVFLLCCGAGLISAATTPATTNGGSSSLVSAPPTPITTGNAAISPTSLVATAQPPAMIATQSVPQPTSIPTPLLHPVQPTPPPQPAATDTPLPQPVATNTPRPQPTATSTPQPAATNTPLPHLFIQFMCAQAADYSDGQVCVHTMPYAQLSITVQYCSGYDATSRSLRGIFTADGAGNQSWEWTPETKCIGTAVATVTAAWQGQTLENSISFQVTGS